MGHGLGSAVFGETPELKRYIESKSLLIHAP
jgi:hypothetical protein